MQSDFCKQNHLCTCDERLQRYELHTTHATVHSINLLFVEQIWFSQQLIADAQQFNYEIIR